MSDTWTISTTLDWTAHYFTKNNISQARLEAETLLASVLHYPRLDLYVKSAEIVPPEKLRIFKEYIKERQKRKPLAYITGEKEFMGLPFKVNEHTLIPRPETELLVEEVLTLIKQENFRSVADIGTGSGNIAISLAALSPIEKVYATDISLETLRTAQENCNDNGVAGKVMVKQGNMLQALEGEFSAPFLDIIVSNPPYIPHLDIPGLEAELSYEPHRALDGGSDGLDFYRIIASQAHKYLRPGGIVAVELNALKSDGTAALFTSQRFSIIKIRKDYADLDRVLIARLP